MSSNLVTSIVKNLSHEQKGTFWQLVQKIYQSTVPVFQYKEADIKTTITTLKQYRNNEKPLHYTIPTNKATLAEALKTEDAIRNRIELALIKANLPVPSNMKEHLLPLSNQDLRTLAIQILDTIDKAWHYR